MLKSAVVLSSENGVRIAKYCFGASLRLGIVVGTEFAFGSHRRGSPAFCLSLLPGLAAGVPLSISVLVVFVEHYVHLSLRLLSPSRFVFVASLLCTEDEDVLTSQTQNGNLRRLLLSDTCL